MNTDPVSNTYAQALLAVAVDQGKLEEVNDEVKYLSDLLRDDPKLRLFIENPRLDAKVKKGAFEAAMRGKVSDIFLNFLQLLIDKNRQLLLREVLGEFRVLHDAKIGLVRAEAVSAVPLTGELLEWLKNIMSEKLEKQIEISNRVDPSILGGLVVRHSGMVADASLKTSLEEVRSRLSTVKFGSDLVHED